jgi:uncharacterized protein (DUF952 family)
VASSPPPDGAREGSPLLLHITTPAAWDVALQSGEYVAESLRTVGFIHLSTAQTVAMPANALYAGRADLVLLVIDPTRLTAPVRWEPGDPHAELVFPHLYGGLPVSAVVDVVPYAPAPDGAFHAPHLTVG